MFMSYSIKKWYRTLFASLCLICALALNAGSVSAAHTPTPSGLAQGKSQIVQNPAWIARKKAGLVGDPRLSGPRQPACPVIVFHPSIACQPPPSSYLMSTSGLDVQEPPGSTSSGGSVKDDRGDSYTDANMWNNCGPGASTVSLSYWVNTNIAGSGYNSYYDHKTTTWWNDTHHHAFVMYLATTVDWPGESGWPGEIDYNSNGTSGGTGPSNMVDAMNWVASGENPNTSNWASWFYYAQSITNTGSTNASMLNADIVADVSHNIPPVADIQAADLGGSHASPPDWHGNSVGHYVAIVGYDNVHDTYTYVETCGQVCGGVWGIHTISQSQLLQAIVDYGQVLIW